MDTGVKDLSHKPYRLQQAPTEISVYLHRNIQKLHFMTYMLYRCLKLKLEYFYDHIKKVVLSFYRYYLTAAIDYFYFNDQSN